MYIKSQRAVCFYVHFSEYLLYFSKSQGLQPLCCTMWIAGLKVGSRWKVVSYTELKRTCQHCTPLAWFCACLTTGLWTPSYLHVLRRNCFWTKYSPSLNPFWWDKVSILELLEVEMTPLFGWDLKLICRWVKVFVWFFSPHFLPETVLQLPALHQRWENADEPDVTDPQLSQLLRTK